MPISNCALNSETWEFDFEFSGTKTVTFTRSGSGASNVGTWRDSENLTGVWVVNRGMITMNQNNSAGPTTDPFIFCARLIRSSQMSGMVGNISDRPNPTQTFTGVAQG